MKRFLPLTSICLMVSLLGHGICQFPEGDWQQKCFATAMVKTDGSWCAFTTKCYTYELSSDPHCPSMYTFHHQKVTYTQDQVPEFTSVEGKMVCTENCYMTHSVEMIEEDMCA